MSNSNCKMQVFHKNVSHRSEKQIRQEVEFQYRAEKLGLCPKIIDTDYKTYIDMEDVGQMCVADMYGDKSDDIPKKFKYEIYLIISRLYLECDIEYVDVTPYNFIEADGKLWIIDFGDAKPAPKKNWFLQEMFKAKKLSEWNPDFR